MAASANPPWNQDGAHAGSSFQGVGAVGDPVNGNSGALAAPDHSAPGDASEHSPGLAVEWTPEELSILDDGLAKYASEPSVIRYATIAAQLHNKTVRDVALRCRWMSSGQTDLSLLESEAMGDDEDIYMAQQCVLVILVFILFA